jgi:hypothetical protein
MKRALILLTILLSTSSALAEGETSSSGAKYNFRFSPLGLIVGLASVSVDIAIHPEWTVGPEFSYAKFNVSTSGINNTSTSTLDVNVASAGLRANWFKNGVYTDGLYVGPFARYATTNINATGATTVTGKTSGVAVGSLIGYGWFWNSFNMMLGAGAALAAGDSNMVVTDSNGNQTTVPNRGAGLAAEYSLGWTF